MRTHYVTAFLAFLMLTLTGCQTLNKIDWDDPLVQVGIDTAIRNAARFGMTLTLEWVKTDRDTAMVVKASLLTAAAYLNGTPADQVVDAELLERIPDKYEQPLAQAIAIVRAFADRYEVPPEQVKGYIMLALANAIIGCDDYMRGLPAKGPGLDDA